MNRIRQKNLEDISKFTVIPDGWKEVTIQEICNIGRGRVISQEEIKSNLGIYPVYSSQTRNNGRMGSIDTYDFDGEFITWTTDGENAGTVFHRLGKFNCTNVCGTLTAKDDEVDHSFLSYHLGRIAKSYVSYIGNPKLMNGVMGDIGLILPPLDEQQKIAKILRTVDNLIEKTQTLIEKYTAIKQGMMADLFTRGIDMTMGDTPNSKGGKLRPSVEDAPELYKQTELGWVPKEWEVERVETVARVVDSMHQTPVFSEHGFPMVRVTDIKGGAINLEGCAKVSASVYEQFIRQYEPKKGDVVLSRVGSYGVSSYADSEEKYCMGQNTVVITSNNDLSYLYLLFQASLIKNQFDLSIAGSSQKSLSLKAIKNTLIPIPSNEERLEITKRLDTLNSRLTIEKQFLLKMKNKKKGLMQDLLTGKVRVS